MLDVRSSDPDRRFLRQPSRSNAPTLVAYRRLSALGDKADIPFLARDVRFRSKADITLFKDARSADTIIWSGLDSDKKRREFITLLGVTPL
jgi:hypothetical protein